MSNHRYLKNLLGKKKKKPFHTPKPWLKTEIGMKTKMRVCYMEFITTDKYIFPKWAVTLRKTEVKMFNLVLQ